MLTTARVAQQQALTAKNASSSATSGASGGATIGTVGRQQRVEALQRALHARDPVAPRGDEVDVVGGAHGLAAPDAQGDARVVVAPRARPASGGGRPSSRPRAKPPVALIGAISASGGEFDRPRSCAPAARQAARLRSKARATVGSRPSSMSRRRHREAPCATAGAAAAAPCGRRGPRAATTASRTDRVIARDGVERRRQRHGAVDRHQPRRALEADDALQRGRDADRAAGVGAERSPGGAGGDRHRAARGRAARDARRRIERRASPGWPACRECGLMPTPEKANSVMLVRPISAAPAARRRATAGASAAAGGASAQDRRAGARWPRRRRRTGP